MIYIENLWNGGKGFYRQCSQEVLQSVVNSWTFYKELQHKIISLLQFIIALYEDLIAHGCEVSSNKHRQYGSKKWRIRDIYPLKNQQKEGVINVTKRKRKRELLLLVLHACDVV